MTPESFVHALDQLDPGSRALLDLSLHRGMEDGEIAELLGSDPDYVSSSREAAMAQIAEDLGLHGDGEQVRSAIAEMGEAAWRPQPAAGSGQPAEEEGPTEPKPAKRSQRRLTLFVLLVVAAVAAVVIAAGGSSNKSTTAQKPAPPAQKPAPKTAPAGRHQITSGGLLRPLSAASGARGRARLNGPNLTLTVSGLPKPAGTYEVWLYNNEIDAVPVTSFASGSTTVNAKLPASPGGYRYLDVSLEPADGNPNHSGQSLLRAPLRSLR